MTAKMMGFPVRLLTKVLKLILEGKKILQFGRVTLKKQMKPLFIKELGFCMSCFKALGEFLGVQGVIYRIEDNRFSKERTKRRKDRWKMGEKNNLIREGEKNVQFGTGSLKRKCTK